MTGETVLFAYEEAIGFMCGSAVLDKVPSIETRAMGDTCVVLYVYT